MELEGSLPGSQEPATGSYTQPEASRPHLSTLFLNIHYNIIFSSTSRSSAWSVPFWFLDENLYAFLISPMHTACPPISSFVNHAMKLRNRKGKAVPVFK